MVSPQKGHYAQGRRELELASPEWNAGPGNGGRKRVPPDPLVAWFEAHFSALEQQGARPTTSCTRYYNMRGHGELGTDRR